MNETLLERYHRDPLATREALEAAARLERARYIGRFLKQSAEALFGPGHSRNSRTKPLVSGPEPDCCP